jgi:hypothetical protein
MSESTASRWARIAAAIVLAIGLAVVIPPVVKHAHSLYRGDPFTAPRAVTVVVRTQGRSVERTTTTKDVDEGLLDGALSAGGSVLVRLAICVLLAFLAGALVQRLLLGQFSLKLGPLEVPELQAAAAVSEELAEEVVALKTAVAGQQREVAALNARLAEVLMLAASLARQVSDPPSADPPPR